VLAGILHGSAANAGSTSLSDMDMQPVTGLGLQDIIPV
jgi:hypothetical protein